MSQTFSLDEIEYGFLHWATERGDPNPEDCAREDVGKLLRHMEANKRSQSNSQLRVVKVFQPLSGRPLYNVLNAEDRAVNPRPMYLDEAHELIVNYGG